MKKFIFFLLIQLVINKKIQLSEYCYSDEACTGIHHYQCSEILCSKDKLSCQGFKLWEISQIKSAKADRALEKFTQLIHECPPWNPKDVCLNSAVCYRDVRIPYRLMNSGKIVIRKPTKCECKEKYSHSCGKDKVYCTKDKGACDWLNTTVANFAKCI